MSMPFSAPDPPEFVDEEEQLMRDVETLRVGLDVLDTDARTRVMAHIIGELCITEERYAALREYLDAKYRVTDGKQFRQDLR